MSKISALTALSTPRQDDVFPVVDVHDTSEASTGTTKKIAMGAMRARCIFIDDYGADPTGATLSDSAWTAAYSAATAAITGSGSSLYGGVMIVFGCGLYKFSINTVKITDSRIGMQGQGAGATTLYTTGGSGDLVYICSATGQMPTLPVGGFHLNGFSAGSGANGLHFGDRWYSHISNIVCDGWSNAAFLFKNDQNSGIGHEGDHFSGLVAKSSTVGYQFDGGNTTGSGSTRAFNYCEYFMHVIDCGTAVKAYNNAQLFGNTFSLHGAMGSANYPNSQVFSIGEGTGNFSALNMSLVNIVLEITGGATSVKDFVCLGNGANGILDCYGGINFILTGGTLSAGSLGGSSVIRFNGTIIGCPLVNGFTATQKDTHFGTRILGCNSAL